MVYVVRAGRAYSTSAESRTHAPSSACLVSRTTSEAAVRDFVGMVDHVHEHPHPAPARRRGRSRGGVGHGVLNGVVRGARRGHHGRDPRGRQRSSENGLSGDIRG
jgi:hypothetical protein